MAYWIYKCNSRNLDHQRHSGDWEDFFAKTITKPNSRWGTTEVVPQLVQLGAKDTILCYQTDRNELVGVAEVVQKIRNGKFFRIILKPVERIGVKVRPLKQLDSRIAAIPALQPGPIKTLYEIHPSDALHFLKQAKLAKK